MSESSSPPTVLATSAFLALTAQSVLIAPHLQPKLASTLTAENLFILSITAFVISVVLISTIVMASTSWQRRILESAAALIVAAFAIVYIFIHAYPEAIILIGLTYCLIVSIFSIKRPARLHAMDWIILANLGINSVMGIGLLFFPTAFLPDPSYQLVRQWHIAFGLLFAASTIIASVGLFETRSCGPHFQRLLAVPWLIWGTTFLVSTNLSNVLVAFIIAIVVLVHDVVPWDRMVLPENDVLGHRLFYLTATVNIIIPVLVAWAIDASAAHLPASERINTEMVRNIALLCVYLLSIFSIYATSTVNLTVYNLMSASVEQAESTEESVPPTIWNRMAARLAEPFKVSQNAMRNRIRLQEQQIDHLSEQLISERRRAIQLMLLKELSQQLESNLDYPVAAQLTANAIHRAFGSALVAIMSLNPEREEFVITASTGSRTNVVPSGFCQSAQDGLIGRATRLHKAIVINDARNSAERITFRNQDFLSELVVPLIHNGQLKGVILLDDEKPNAFDVNDIDVLEAAGGQLLSAWERSDYDQRLTELIQGGITISRTQDPSVAIEQVAAIALQVFNCRFVFAAHFDRESGTTRTAHSGYAPTLEALLDHDKIVNALIEATLDNPRAFRLRDVRKQFPSLQIGDAQVRSLLAVPVRLHQRDIGVVLAFGRRDDLFFSDVDEALGNLLANQAAGAIESALLNVELRTTLNMATQLYELSIYILQAEKLSDAAAAIAEVAYRLSRATATGIVLFTQQKEVEAKVQIDSSGTHSGTHHPMSMITKALQTGQGVIVSQDSFAKVSIPIQTPRRQYGALWFDIPEKRWYNARYEANLQTLANQAAIALERILLLVETRQQTEQIKTAYKELQITYDQTLVALTSALDARDRETEGHSVRVARIACTLGLELGLSQEEAKILERGALLHDIGKIGISDTILHKPGPLTDEEWSLMRHHPDIGAHIIEGIPFLQEVLPVIKHHQERWDGSGYPSGMKNDEIPLLARIFAVADAFDALTSNRPYRDKVSINEALAQIQAQAGILYDAKVVSTLERLIREGQIEDFVA
jgi:putative nucleotidyltransferase with HDIG domain